MIIFKKSNIDIFILKTFFSEQESFMIQNIIDDLYKYPEIPGHYMKYYETLHSYNNHWDKWNILLNIMKMLKNCLEH